MLTPCAKHVVAKAASKAATENLILEVAIGDSLEFAGSLYIRSLISLRITLSL